MSDAPVRTYEIVSSTGTVRMNIPEDWKVTFGPVSPGAKSFGGDGNALRVYESETKQRAIFLGVLSFRDLSIPVQRLLVKRKGETEFKSDNSGNYSGKQREIVERKWVSEEEFLNATSGTSEEQF